MSKIEIKLSVTTKELLAIIDILDCASESNVEVPTTNVNSSQDKVLTGATKAFPELPKVPKQDAADVPEKPLYGDPIPSPVSNFVPPIEDVVDEVPEPTTATRKKGGKKGPTMPGFGRTTTQIATFAAREEARTEELDEEAELRAQRKEERNARKAEREAEEAEKAEALKREEDLISNIKAADAEVAETVATTIIKKPWVL